MCTLHNDIVLGSDLFCFSGLVGEEAPSPTGYDRALYAPQNAPGIFPAAKRFYHI